MVFRYPNSLKSNLISNTSNKPDSGMYKIPCRDCNKFYIGETGRPFCSRFKEHKQCIRSFNTSNGLALHCTTTGHSPDFDNFTALAHCNNFRARRVIESAFIKVHSDDCLNLNSGFHCIDSLTSERIVNSVH